MNSHLQLNDKDLEMHFSECTLDPGLFVHEAHLRLAWIHVIKYGSEKAAKNLCEQIARFDQTFGNGTKFNTTVTIASVKVIEHFVQKSVSGSFTDFMNEFPRLKTNFKDLLAFHYGINIFTDEKAKNIYLEPDLMPFE